MRAHVAYLFVEKPTDLDPWALRKDGDAAPAVVRHYVGIAKKDSARALSDAGLVQPGGVWAVRLRCLPIGDRAYQVNVVRYMGSHADRDAAVWTIRSTTRRGCGSAWDWWTARARRWG